MNSDEKNDKYRAALISRKKINRLRRLQPVERSCDKAIIKTESGSFLDFCSNDYLGLANHPELKKRSIEYTEKFGTSSSASRLITGTLSIHHELEDQLSSLYSREALLFNTGYQANATVIPALTGRNDTILADKKCHNSILHGCKTSNAQLIRYQHNDLNHLEKLLMRHSAKNTGVTWVITESVFSMDGDFAAIDEIGNLCKKFGAYFYVDDAHSTGLFGRKGLGLGAYNDQIDLLLETFGKAAGAFGAVALMNQELKEYLINYCDGFIYSTSLPPSAVGSISAAFDLIPGMIDERDHLINMSDYLRSELVKSGCNTLNSGSQIIPVLIGSDAEAIKISNRLKSEGIYILAIRPPTVPEGESRLRITISAKHSKEEIDILKKALLDE